MLSQTPRAILMRDLRARRREIDPPKPRGRKPDHAKHLALIEAYERAKAKAEWALDRLVIREGYAHRDSLLKAYRRALSQRAPSPDLSEGGGL